MNRHSKPLVNRKAFLCCLIAGSILSVTPAAAFAPGRGGGGRAGGRSMSRPAGGAMHAPSMSRPNISRPNVSRPSMPTPNISRPSLPANRPNVSLPNTPMTRPNIPTTRPNIPTTRPSIPTNRPSLPNNPPNLPTTRPGGGGIPNMPSVRPGGGPNLPSQPGTTRPGGITNRPNLPAIPAPGGQRPSAGGLSDFLNLPGPDPGFSRPALPSNRPSLPSTRPSVPETLPARVPNQLPQTRPSNNLPNVNLPTNRPNINVDNIRNQYGGGHNVNIGNIDIDVRNNNFNDIRNNWTNLDSRPFNNNWWTDPGFSRPPAYWRWQTGWGRYPGNWCWRPCAWATLGTWFVWSVPQPITYNYGTNVVYRDNYVYVNDQQVSSASDYYQQANTIAESIPAEVKPESVDWMPLGVFELTDAEGNDMSMMLQLAVSKEGIIAGTYYNTTNEKSRPVEGMVDNKTQRAAWQFADDKESTMVMEAGIFDLTKDETPALLHFDSDNTQNWMLVRLPAPEE